MTLGLMRGEEADDNNSPKVVAIGQRYLDCFEEVNGSILCGKITPNKRNFCLCNKAMCSAPGLLLGLTNEKVEAVAVYIDKVLYILIKNRWKQIRNC